ncbi:protein MEN-8 [Diospyros lotus]|uniref:protein MEN-8 n=1 Tax=Diospyros lotus TaxID=55363 RepID=UPI00224F2923|nr:protein MEN-8 [Diospyros lotus]
MASTKPLRSLISSRATMFLFVVAAAALAVPTQVAEAQAGCTSQLGSLNVCAPFVLPGASSPSAECCTALQGIDHECLCNTLRISARLPSSCNLPPLACGTLLNTTDSPF